MNDGITIIFLSNQHVSFGHHHHGAIQVDKWQARDANVTHVRPNWSRRKWAQL